MAEEFNPKDAIGRTKLPVHLWPSIATAYGSIGMLEGQTKYGRSNFRAAKVAASVYYAAAKRHLDAWFEGEENTKEGGPHLGNALACIAIILDAKLVGTLVDDRQYNPAEPDAFSKMVDELTAQGRELAKKVQPKVEPRHWDKRDEKDQTQEFAKEAEKVLVNEVIVLKGQHLIVPSTVDVTHKNSDSARMCYIGPMPNPNTFIELNGHDNDLRTADWPLPQILLQRAMRDANPSHVYWRFTRILSDDYQLGVSVDP